MWVVERGRAEGAGGAELPLRPRFRRFPCKGAAVVSTTLRYAAGQFEDDQNTRRLAPATTLDGFASLPLTRTLAVEARAENVFDERGEAGNTGADLIERATPRTIWLGLRLRTG